MTAEDVVEIYSSFLERGVQLWLDGGWGIDALLERQTRPHTDLDAVAAFDQLPALGRVLNERGFALRKPWAENKWVPYPEVVALIGRRSPACEVATAFVVSDSRERVVDIPVVRFSEGGRGLAVWNTDFVFPETAFAGQGAISTVPVRCLSVETQMRTHAGSGLPAKQADDVRRLRERFGLDHPDPHATGASTL